MKAFAFALLALVFVPALSLRAEPAADLRSPKSEYPRLLRIFLYLPGSDRLIDYPDVEKILCCEAARITFETQDGHIVMHHGAYTVIQPRTATGTTTSGTKFHDPK